MEIQNFQKNILRGDNIVEEKLSNVSSTSSPAHEFSFTISLHHHQQPSSAIQDKLNPPSPPPFSTAVDLSPADNIFFHGHLLPLHLLSHFPIISPRSSTNSIDSFTLPETDIILEEEEDQQILDGNISFQGTENVQFDDENLDNTSTTKVDQGRIKSKAFSLFSLSKWQKSRQVQKNDQETKNKKKVIKFDVVSHVVKKYIRMVRMSLGSRRSSSSSAEMNKKFRQQPHSFSGSTSSRYNQHKYSGGRRRAQFSAPASLGTSPANSGPLVGNGGLGTPTSDSSMEELQAAIQAAITHCKNSIATRTDHEQKIN